MSLVWFAGIDLMAFSFQMPCHLVPAVLRRVQNLFVYECDQFQIISALAFALIIKRGARQRYIRHWRVTDRPQGLSFLIESHSPRLTHQSWHVGL